MPIDDIARRKVSVTVNLHGSSVELRTVTKERLVGRYAYGKYLPIGVDRLLRLFESHDIRATFFVPGAEARTWPAIIREIVSQGHEIAAHGDAFEDHSELGDKEAEVLKRAHESIAEIAGTAPVGWRAPDGLLSPKTLSLLAGMGYLYDSSFQDDDYPYSLRADDGGDMIEIPQNEMLMDSTFFAIRQTHDRVLKNWTEEFNGSYAEGCYNCITVHPRPDYGVGRASRIDMLDTFLHHVKQAGDNVQFSTCSAIASAVREATLNP